MAFTKADGQHPTHWIEQKHEETKKVEEEQI